MEHIQLVTIDLDGTILDNNKECRVRTQQTVKKLIDKGIKVCFATGRAYRDTKNIAESCGVKHCVATVNGACIHENGEIVHATELDKTIIQEIADYSREKDLFLWLYTRNGVFNEITNELYDELIRNFPFFKTPNLVNFDDIHAMFKGLFLVRMDVAKLIIDRFATHPVIKTVLTTPSINDPLPPHDPVTYVELLNKSVNKGTAIDWISEYYNIPMENILVFGDEDNDIEMLKNAGVSVAMGNSEPHIKDIADYVTLTNDEDGVADFIEKYLL